MPRAEMHWDYICLTLLTIATAVLAGVFFVLSIENPETRLSGWAGELSSMMAGLATALYLWMVIRTSRVLFVPQQYGAPRRLERKREETRQAFASFGSMILPLMVVIILTLIIPVYTAQETSPEQRTRGLEVWPETRFSPSRRFLNVDCRCNSGFLKRIAYTTMPYKTGLRLLGVARNPANGFPARLLGAPSEIPAGTSELEKPTQP